MDSLRIILILGGIALIVVIYLWDRLRSRKRAQMTRWQDLDSTGEDLDYIDPLINNDSPFDGEWKGDSIKASRGDGGADGDLEGLKGIVALANDDFVENEPETANESVIILSLMAAEGTTFNGMQLLDAMELCGITFGDMNIFHYIELESGQPLFSIANVLEPGSFDKGNMGELETPGLALFMPLPAPIDGEKALLTFVRQAKRLRDLLNGKLTDSQRRELTRDTLDDLKSTARRFRVIAD